MQNPHRNSRLYRLAAVTTLIATSAVASAAIASPDPSPLVFENRYVKSAAAKVQAESVHPEPKERPKPESVIEALLAPATISVVNEDESATEPVAAEPETETTDSLSHEAADQAEAEEPRVDGGLAPLPTIQPIMPSLATTSVITDILPIESPSTPWQPAADTSTNWPAQPDDLIPHIEPPPEMRHEMDAVWSNESAGEAVPPHTSAAPPVLTPYAPLPFAPTTEELSLQLLPSVRKAYALARHGAVYAAQTEFIQVLRRIAQAKDAAEGIDEHSRALAVGLRALEEADDFIPRGSQLEGEMNVPVVASAHRTPVLGNRLASARPDEAIALYHQFAREQLARSVAGEQAGSMALYGLGKVQNRLAYESEGELRHERQALVMFQAALDAAPSNHLAANEIGVLLSRGGQPLEAAEMFRRAIDVAPSSTGYHNLAVVESKLGRHEQAAANEQYAQYLAMQDRAAGAISRRNGVAWVAPQDMGRVGESVPAPGAGPQMANGPQPERLPATSGPLETVAKWPQKLVPGVFRR